MRNRLVRIVSEAQIVSPHGVLRRLICILSVVLLTTTLSYSQSNFVPRPVIPAVLGGTGTVLRSTSVLRISPRLTKAGAVAVVTRDPSGLHATTNLISTSAGTVEVEAASQAQHILIPTNTAKLSAFVSGRNTFPGSLIISTPGEAASHGELFLEPNPNPLTWNASARVYSAKLVVGLDLTNQQSSVTLRPPVVVQFFASNATVNPDRLTIYRTGSEGYQQADITCQPRQRHASVKARSDLGELLRSVPVEGFDAVGQLLDIFPIPFLFASLIGGAAGGFLRCLHRPVGTQESKTRRTCEGTIVGLIITGAVAAGIHIGDLSQEIVNQPIGVFIVATFAGYGGTAIMDRVTNRFFDLASGDAKKTVSDSTP